MTQCWMTLLAVGAVTFLYRFSCLGLVAKRELDPQWNDLLRFVPPAAFAALVAPELFLRGGRLIPGVRDPRLLAGAFAAMVAWKTRSVVLTIASGMVVLHLLQRLW